MQCKIFICKNCHCGILTEVQWLILRSASTQFPGTEWINIGQQALRVLGTAPNLRHKLGNDKYFCVKITQETSNYVD